MKRVMLIFIFFLFSLSGIAATPVCDLSVQLINQDPYPAIPGDYVKIVFQVDGISNINCNQITFELVEKYPIIFDEGTNPVIIFGSGFYGIDYGSFLVAPYKVRIDENALDGITLLEVKYKYGGYEGYETSRFDLEIQDSRVDFEVFVKEYNPVTNQMTIEILNIGDSDVEAVKIEIPRQGGVDVKGSNIALAGDLDSNEYTTADFNIVSEIEEINLTIFYSDATNVRRILEKVMVFEEEYFKNRPGEGKKTSKWVYLIIISIIAYIVYYFYKKDKKKEEHKHKR